LTRISVSDIIFVKKELTMIDINPTSDTIDDYVEDLTGTIPEADEKQFEPVSERIRLLREEKGLSLEELAALTGFETDLLMKIEENHVQPQLGTAIKLSKALDSALSIILSGAGDRHYTITRKDDRKAVSRSTTDKGNKQLYTYKSLAPDVEGRHMESLVVHLEENQEGSDLTTHGGEEFLYVIDGVCELQLGDDRFELEPGDSVYYFSSVPHLIAAKNKKATILAVIYSGE
jgi:quercetin dioxygenase-like cupin family protein/DNA-binding transcriptional regulator YiaG